MLNFTQKLKIDCVWRACMLNLFILQFQKSQMAKGQRCLKTSKLFVKSLTFIKRFCRLYEVIGNGKNVLKIRLFFFLNLESQRQTSSRTVEQMYLLVIALPVLLRVSQVSNVTVSADCIWYTEHPDWTVSNWLYGYIKTMLFWMKIIINLLLLF